MCVASGNSIEIYSLSSQEAPPNSGGVLVMGLREARRAQERLWGKETTLGSSELKADQVEASRKARTCHLQMTPSHQKVHSVSSVGAQNKSNIIIAVKYIPPQARGMIYLKTELSTLEDRNH